MKFSSITTRIALFAFLSTGLLVTGCKKDEETEQENITTIILHLTGPGYDRMFAWEDLDGDGGNAPLIAEIEMPPLTGNITCEVLVYDKSKSPVANITEEILEESDVHLFTFTIDGADFTISDSDQDSNGAPFRQKTTWQTDQPSTGTLNVRLYHEPSDKTSTTNPGGEVDFDVTFPVKIQ